MADGDDSNENKKNYGWMLILVCLISIGATAYRLYWDFVEDWGLCQGNSRNKWLRDELNFDSTYYYISMVLNVLLRIVSLLPIFLSGNVGDRYFLLITFLVAVLEVIRRGLWKYFRLENEHVKYEKLKRNLRNVLAYVIGISTYTNTNTSIN